MGWEPIDITTPVAWQGFWGRRIGKTSWGLAAALSWHALYFGLQIIGTKPNDARGIGLALGPLWLGVARLKPKQEAML
jgi:hypothetical protein